MLLRENRKHNQTELIILYILVLLDQESNVEHDLTKLTSYTTKQTNKQKWRGVSVKTNRQLDQRVANVDVRHERRRAHAAAC